MKSVIPHPVPAANLDAPPPASRTRHTKRSRRRRGGLSLPGLQTSAPPGTTPGIESIEARHHPPEPGTIAMECVDYGAERVERYAVEDLAALLTRPRPDWASVRWLNINGLHPYIVDQLRKHFGFHTLAAEDVLRVPQRPKLEAFEDHLYLVTRLVTIQQNRPASEQVSMFLYPNTLLTLQERAGDAWDPIRNRLENPTARLRKQGTGYLIYALLDAAVDQWFPILEHYGESLEELEDQVLRDPTPKTQQRIHALKRELSALRRVVWPVREQVQALQREERREIDESVKTYLRDVYDHTVQVMDIVETHREMAANLNDLYMSAVSNRMNEIMKVLTLMASFFIPITFFAGVYGMNFEHIPELKWAYSYLFFWVVCLGVAGFLGVFFYRKGWIGSRSPAPDSDDK